MLHRTIHQAARNPAALDRELRLYKVGRGGRPASERYLHLCEQAHRALSGRQPQ